MAWKDTIRLRINCRRVRINPRKKREEYIQLMEEVMIVCNRIASNPGAYEKLQIRALDCMIRAMRACYGMVSDVEVEMIEEEIKELEKKEEEYGFLGYKLPDPPH